MHPQLQLPQRTTPHCQHMSLPVIYAKHTANSIDVEYLTSVPGLSLSVRSFELTTALSGNPFARPYHSHHPGQCSDEVELTLAIIRRSGRTPLYSVLNIRPVLPNPLCTSS